MNSAIINVGGGLTVEDGVDYTRIFNFEKVASDHLGACIDSSNNENLSANIIVNNRTFIDKYNNSVLSVAQIRCGFNTALRQINESTNQR